MWFVCWSHVSVFNGHRPFTADQLVDLCPRSRLWSRAFFCRNHCFANHHVLCVLLCEAPPPKWHPTVRYFVPRCFSATSNSGWFRKAARMTCVRMCLLFARCFPTGRPFERLPFHMSAVLRGTFRVGAHSNASCDLEPLNACHCFEWASIRMGPM